MLFEKNIKHTMKKGPTIWMGLLAVALIIFISAYAIAFFLYLEQPDQFTIILSYSIILGYPLLAIAGLGGGSQLFVENKRLKETKASSFLMGFGGHTKSYFGAQLFSSISLLMGIFFLGAFFKIFF